MMRIFWTLLFALASCKRGADDTKWGEPVGIDLTGQDVMAAVAIEAGHEIDGAAVPELATALAGVTKACPAIKTIGTNALSIRMSVKDGTIAAPTDPDSDALAQCVSRELDGKPAKKLGTTKLLVQIVAKEKK
jgi:hypothetical protein